MIGKGLSLGLSLSREGFDGSNKPSRSGSKDASRFGSMGRRNRGEYASDLGEDVKLSPEEEKKAHEVFEAYDYDGGGSIDNTELHDLFVELKWTIEQASLEDFLARIFGEAVTSVDYGQFLKLYRAILARQPASVRKHAVGGMKGASRIDILDLRDLESNIRREFEEVNVDGSGFLNVDEMRQVLRQSGLPDPDGDDYESATIEHMQFADKDQDGRVSFEEFVHYRNAVLDYTYRRELEALENLDPSIGDEHGPQFGYDD